MRNRKLIFLCQWILSIIIFTVAISTANDAQYQLNWSTIDGGGMSLIDYFWGMEAKFCY